MKNKIKNLFVKVLLRIGSFFIVGQSRYKFIFSHAFMPHPDEMMLKNAFDFCSHNKIVGDYLEFGVWKGRSFIRSYHIWRHVLNDNPTLKDMKFFAFDSFEGLPEIVDKQDKTTNEFKKGQYNCDLESFKSNLRKNNVEMDRVTTVKGWYENTLNLQTKKTLSCKKASIIFIDCDLYSSTVSVLDFITDYIQDGTIVIFDDWFCFKGDPQKGERKAFSEWLSKNQSFSVTEFKRFNWRGNSFIIHKKS